MSSFYAILIFKILSFIGALLNTAGFLTFITLDSLAPYRWQLILGGIALIAIAELATYLIQKTK
jgi:hypothetical protein